MTNPSITPSGALDKHIRLYDYHSDTLLLCVCMLCSWVLLLIVVALIFDMRRAMIVGSILCPPMFGAYVLSRRTHLEITEDGLRYVGVLKRISVPWNQVRSVSEVWRTWQGYRRCRPYAIVLTDAGKFRVQASLESADAPTFKSYSTGGPTPCYGEVMEEIGRRANSQWTLSPDGLFHPDDTANRTRERWALVGRALAYFVIIVVLVALLVVYLWVFLRS